MRTSSGRRFTYIFISMNNLWQAIYRTHLFSRSKVSSSLNWRHWRNNLDVFICERHCNSCVSYNITLRNNLKMHNRSQSRGRLHLSKITLFGVPYHFFKKICYYHLIIPHSFHFCFIYYIYYIFISKIIHIHSITRPYRIFSINDYTIK